MTSNNYHFGDREVRIRIKAEITLFLWLKSKPDVKSAAFEWNSHHSHSIVPGGFEVTS
jgi:hypothetical protein